ncbi:hypothetical protein NDU88_008974 [Pleurodeles waltl]|uniref:Uncharacterized protein n=1 Tax=Pleurodeles waltl TaxID=8319 RepID=A0AAV7PVZ6_PLEWA|nr:hypothetical protein NDU88_008974 [Pleurodeles waltl]
MTLSSLLGMDGCVPVCFLPVCSACWEYAANFLEVAAGRAIFYVSSRLLSFVCASPGQLGCWEMNGGSSKPGACLNSSLELCDGRAFLAQLMACRSESCSMCIYGLGPVGLARCLGELCALMAREPFWSFSEDGGKSKAKNWARSDLFKKLASSIQKEHGYSSSQAQDSYDTDSDQSSSKHSSDSDSEEDLGDLSGPSKRKEIETAKAPPSKAPRVLTFSPEEIIHPHSSSWTPPPEVAEYLQNHIRAGFDKDVRARLRAECPHPDLEGKITDTSEIHPTMVTFVKKWDKDPKKGLDQA